MKKMVRIFFFLIVSLSLFPETQVLIRSSHNNALIGDAVTIKVVVRTSTDIERVSLKINPRDFEIVSESDWKTESHKDYQVFEKDVVVSFFKLGEFKLGPFSLDVIRRGETAETRETNTLPLTVKSALSGEDKDIRPLKDLADISGNPFYILKYVLLVLIIAGITVFLILWIKKRKSMPPPETRPAMSPLDELEYNIRGLYAEKLWEKEKQLEFFIRLIDIWKVFLFRIYHFNAEDFTTFETFYYLKKKENNTDILEKMAYVFHMADLVKFARYQPDLSVEKEVSRHTEGLLAIYKKCLAPPPEVVE